MNIRSSLRSAVDRVRAIRGRAKLDAGGQSLILGYHRVLHASEARQLSIQPGMFVTPATLRMHLQILSEYVEFCHLDELIAAAERPVAAAKTQCAITFDDGWVDNFAHAFPVLQEFHCPATIFLASGFIGTTRQFWPERLQRLLNDTRRLQRYGSVVLDEIESLINIEASAIVDRSLDTNKIIEALKQKNDKTICDALDRVDEHLQKLGEYSDAPISMLNWTQIREMTDSGLVRLGSHTAEHTRLSGQVDGAMVVDELTRSRETIKEISGEFPTLFCYPNGEFTQDNVDLVRQYYSAACTITPGWVTPKSDRYLIPRMCLSNGGSDSPHSFLARISG